MKGDPEILKVPQEVLSAELTAINQYFIHARKLRNWRYMRLADPTEKESIGENMKINVAATVPDMMRVDLDLEHDAVKRLNAGIALATQKGDNGTRALFERILVSEEEHIDWLEAQIQQIKDVGAENYLAQRIEGG